MPPGRRQAADTPVSPLRAAATLPLITPSDAADARPSMFTPLRYWLADTLPHYATLLSLSDTAAS